MPVWEEFAIPNATTYPDLLQYISSTTGDAFGMVILLITFGIATIAMGRIDAESLAFSGFITGILAMLLVPLGLINDMFAVALFLITGAATALMVFKRR